MIAAEAYSQCLSILKNAGIESAEQEAKWLLESFCRVAPVRLRLFPDAECNPQAVRKMLSAAKRRADGYPLQYLLGEWEFCSNSFFVGEGVLIPRPETEMLVDIAKKELSCKDDAVVIDLCAGSGCVGISIALATGAKVYEVEKSPEAFAFLRKNIERYPEIKVEASLSDIFDGYEKHCLPRSDLIVSNPPYICSGELPFLQREVTFEPAMALDGGDGGLIFYKCIAEKWFSALKDGGLLAVECGEGQGNSIKSIFSPYFDNITVVSDFAGHDRIVTARKSLDK